jgi:hypothetical protein
MPTDPNPPDPNATSPKPANQPPGNQERDVRPTPEAQEVFMRWLRYLDDEISKHHKPALRGELVRDALHQLYLGRPHGGKLNTTLTSELSANVLYLSIDPANVVLQAESQPDLDIEQFAERKPLIFFWLMFDRLPVALNQWLGCRFRAMLGKHIFKSIGRHVKIYRGLEFWYGYNLTIEDDIVIGQYVTIDDRNGLTIPKGTTIESHAILAHDWKPRS